MRQRNRGPTVDLQVTLRTGKLLTGDFTQQEKVDYAAAWGWFLGYPAGAHK